MNVMRFGTDKCNRWIDGDNVQLLPKNEVFGGKSPRISSVAL
jgi:hypothetical protein